jgi:hypothetical protein
LRQWPQVLWVAVAVLAASLARWSVHGEETAAARDSAWRMQLEALARRCEDEGLPEQAAQTRRWFVARSPGRQYLFVPPATDPLALRPDAPPAVQRWYAELKTLRRQRAEQLFREARECLDQGDATGAYQRLHEVLREDPDHAAARRILGYQRTPGGAWQQEAHAPLTVATSRTDHPRLAWRSGQYFRAEAPHFTVVSNHSRRAAQSAAQTLETLDTLWRQLFFLYWSSPEALQARWRGDPRPLAPPRPAMQVVLFRNRAEYAAHVAGVHPRAAATLGLYQDAQRTAYFFAGEPSVQATWYHEAAHQLFQEAVPQTVQPAGSRTNYWLLEGVAMYLESLTPQEGYWTVGGCEASRLQIARYRTLAGDGGLPWPRLAAMGRDALQDHPEIARLYTQAAGLTHFLMDGQAGQFRAAVCRLLTQIYQGSDTPTSLTELTDQSWEALEEGYRRFLNVTDDDLAAIPAPDLVKDLSLGRTAVTDRGMEHVGRCTQLRWLDLSYTAVTDEGAARLGRCSQLRQLFLEGANVTSAVVPTLATLTELEELDLSRLPLTDDSLAPLARLKNLKALHLVGCPLTDAALEHLRTLKQLERLDARGTQVTPQGLVRLRKSLPRLRADGP